MNITALGEQNETHSRQQHSYWLIRRYPRDIFPNIWHNIEKLAENNAVCICSAVHYETSQANDVLYDWAKKVT